jgi:group II intron reverse transcriptase/maturase
MQPIRKLVEILTDRGRRGLCLERVYRHVCREDLLIEAYAKIGKNDGATTRGIDGETVDGMSMDKIRHVAQVLRDGAWIWKPVRRTHIPKKRGGSRPLGIPNWSDKLVQQMIKFILELYYEPQFSKLSFGFRSGRGCHNALHEVSKWHGTRWFIEGDISKCFDKIDHQVLLSILGESIHDDRFLKLVRTMLQAGYLEDWVYGNTHSGTPQGGICSPVLSNIYLDRLDKFVEDVLLPRYNRGDTRRWNSEWRRLNNLINHHRDSLSAEKYQELVQQRRTVPSRDTHDPDYRRLHYVRYADDFLLGFAGPKSEAVEIKELIREFLSTTLKLQLSEEKTLITHASQGRARFLGYEVQVMASGTKVSPGKGGGLRRCVNGNVGFYVPRDVIEARIGDFSESGKPRQLAHLIYQSDFHIVSYYQAVYRGMVNYYRMAHNSASRLGKLRWALETSLVKTLAGKHRCSCASLWQKHKVKVTSDNGPINAFRVTVPREGKPDLVTHFGGLSLKRESFAPLEDRIVRVFANSTDLIDRLSAEKCQLCGAEGVSLENHHIRRLADLKQKNGRSMPAWKKLMLAMKRKTLTVCARCHTDIHAGRHDGPSLS